MTARILVVGLDACDPTIAQRLAAAGQLPTLHRLFERAARCRVRNPFGLFVGSLWMTFATGLRPDRHHFHCWDEIDVATYVRQLTQPPSCGQQPFWRRLSEAGCRVAVVDVPHSKADVAVNGIEIVEWGCHDRHFGFHASPTAKASEIASAFGLHPIFGLDAYSLREFAPDDYADREGPLRTADEERALFDGLFRGVGAKRNLSLALLADGDWDLFLTVFGESHAIGHQQWHLHDPTHPRFDPALVEAVGGDPVPAIYRELDAALGEMLSLLDAEATVLVLLSHGMGPHHDGTHLLDEVLSRIDRLDRDPSTLTRTPKELIRRATRSLPASLQRRLTAFAVPAIQRTTIGRPLAPCPEYASPEDRARQRFFMEPNNYVYGGVRLNLATREPRGCVQPDGFDEVCKRLTNDLMALVNVQTGGPVVRAVERADRWYRRSPDDTMPDLFVDWERTAPIETVWSAKTGIVHAPYANWRTGDHRPDGLRLAFGPGIQSGTALPSVDLEDLAPSIAGRLGVLLEDIDGQAAPWLVEAVPAPRRQITGTAKGNTLGSTARRSTAT
jgi:predicted AlkP superfamily phosphohydrolase/phosphomutase